VCSPRSASSGWFRRASAITGGGSAPVSYGHTSQKPLVPAKARLSSASCRSHSTSSSAVRAGKIGSPIPRSLAPRAAFRSTNSRQAGMIRAGVGADGRHVAERDRGRVRSERLSERVELVRQRDDERRLTRVQAGTDEAGARADELVEADVEQRLMSEATRRMRLPIGHFGDGHRYSRRGPATPSTPLLSIFASIHAAPGCIVAPRGCR
jgi:hypothetical protein